jgi:hypothetical protein
MAFKETRHTQHANCSILLDKLHSVESTHSDSHGEGTSEEEGTAAYSDVEGIQVFIQVIHRRLVANPTL